MKAYPVRDSFLCVSDWFGISVTETEGHVPGLELALPRWAGEAAALGGGAGGTGGRRCLAAPGSLSSGRATLSRHGVLGSCHTARPVVEGWRRRSRHCRPARRRPPPPPPQQQADRSPWAAAVAGGDIPARWAGRQLAPPGAGRPHAPAPLTRRRAPPLSAVA